MEIPVGGTWAVGPRLGVPGTRSGAPGLALETRDPFPVPYSLTPDLPHPKQLQFALKMRKIALKTVSFQCVSPAITRRMHEIRRLIHGLIRYLILFSSIARLIGR